MKIYEDKYIVLTGGAGFIGSCVLRQLNEQGLKNVIVVDDLGQDEKWKNLNGKLYINYIDQDRLFSWLDGKERDIEAFIHLGACSNTLETNARYLMENNYQFSIRLAEYALTHGHRFIYASSAATYGNGKEGFSDDHALLERYRPLNMYGYSKHAFDLWLQVENVLDKVVGLKYFNVFGPNEYHKGAMSSAILKMVPTIENEGKIRLFKSTEPNKYQDGGQMRDFLYVKDAVPMTLQFLTNNLAGIFNIGTGIARTWKDLALAVASAMQRPVEIEYIDMPANMVANYQNFTVADMNKSVMHRLVMPKFSLEESVADYVKNYVLPHTYW